MLLPAKLPQCPLSQLETPATLGDGGKGRDDKYVGVELMELKAHRIQGSRG
jgi:hypothetical protein